MIPTHRLILLNNILNDNCQLSVTESKELLEEVRELQQLRFHDADIMLNLRIQRNLLAAKSQNPG